MQCVRPAPAGCRPCRGTAAGGYHMGDIIWKHFQIINLKIFSYDIVQRSLATLHEPLELPACNNGDAVYRGTSLIGKHLPVGPYHRPMLRVLGGSYGGWAFSCGRGTPVVVKSSVSKGRDSLSIRSPHPQPFRCSANVILIRQSRPYSGLDFPAKVLQTCRVVPSLL